jgi:hypothetical protein
MANRPSRGKLQFWGKRESAAVFLYPFVAIVLFPSKPKGRWRWLKNRSNGSKQQHRSLEYGQDVHVPPTVGFIVVLAGVFGGISFSYGRSGASLRSLISTYSRFAFYKLLSIPSVTDSGLSVSRIAYVLV